MGFPLRSPHWWLALLLCAGCGPFSYLSMVSAQASRSVEEARAVNAEQLAPYEFTAAVEYLHKAREVGGYARYEEAVEWGKKARDYGDKAIELSRRRARLEDAPPLTKGSDSAK
jgi:hypothetical protein